MHMSSWGHRFIEGKAGVCVADQNRRTVCCGQSIMYPPLCTCKKNTVQTPFPPDPVLYSFGDYYHTAHKRVLAT